MNRTRTAVLALFVALTPGSARAELVGYFTGSFQANALGATIPTNSDELSLANAAGSLDLKPGVPVVAPLNGLSFQAGYTGFSSGGVHGGYDAVRAFIVDGVAGVLHQPFTVDVGRFVDTLTLERGPTLTLDLGERGLLEVTPLGVSVWGGSGPPATATVEGQFVLRPAGAPEPGALALAGVGLALLTSARLARRGGARGRQARPAPG